MLVTFKIICVCMYFLGLHTPAFYGHTRAFSHAIFLLFIHFFIYLGKVR